jgi:hypothetical protein
MWASSKKPAAETKAQSPEERRRQLRLTAATIIDENKIKLSKSLAAAKQIESNQYYYYGYILATMSGTMAACLSLGTRLPVLRTSASMIALAGGYFGGGFLHKAHVQYNMVGVAKIIDNQITELKSLSEKVQGAISDYDDHIAELNSMKRQLLPLSPEAIADREEQIKKSNMTIDERADLILQAYEKRKAAMVGQK